jgi:hypothetical protein
MTLTNSLFHCHHARLHTLSPPPTLREANGEQLRAHQRNMEAANANKITPRFGTDQDDADGFFESACHGVLEHEDRWRQCGLVWAWVDERPAWISPIYWDFDILEKPAHEMTRTFRMTLLGGGQIAIREEFERSKVIPKDEGVFCFEPKLRVTTDAGSGLQRFSGIIESTGCEMGAHAVLFLPGTPQSVADRVAATFKLLGAPGEPPDRDNFMALLDRSERCCVCNRALRDLPSTLLGIGPDCAKQMRLPHGLQAANRILQRRRELLGDHDTAPTPALRRLGLHCVSAEIEIEARGEDK